MAAGGPARTSLRRAVERGGGAIADRLGNMSVQRRRGLLRLGALILALILGIVLLISVLGGGDTSNPNGVVYRDAADTPGPLDILSAQMDQQGPQLVLTLRTAGIWTPGQLAEQPGRYVCTTLWAKDDRQPRSRICVVSRGGNPSLQLQRFLDGRAQAPRPLVGQIRRRNLKLLEARFSFRDARLPLGRFRWRVETLWTGDPGGCPPAAVPVARCLDNLPDKGTSPGTVTEPLLLGCTPTGPPYVDNGPRTENAVALTFDDGPSDFTPQVLDILRRERVRATFFVVGEQIAGREELLRRELDQGGVIGNHTFTHINTAGAGPEVSQQLDDASAAIKKATNFVPCLFRPPSGAKSPQSIALVKSKGMQAVGWDVDTSDYQRPPSSTIVRRVLSGAQAGSIVLMHDGGGERDQTVQALPQIIKGLRAKGYRFVTVDQLLGATEHFA